MYSFSHLGGGGEQDAGAAIVQEDSQGVVACLGAEAAFGFS